MNLVLHRTIFTEDSTIGGLFIDGRFVCYTLEDKDRKLETGGKKIYAKTAIPRGTYEVIINFSNRFKEYMPLVLRVPQFEGIRIHIGNTAADTEGCILLGKLKGANQILKSKDAYNEVMKILKSVEKNEKIQITIN